MCTDWNANARVMWNYIFFARVHKTMNILFKQVWLDSLVVNASNPMIARSGVRLQANPLSGNNPGQVVHTTGRRCDAPVWRSCQLRNQIQIQKHHATFTQ